MKLTWYGIRNIAMAIIVAAVGSAAVASDGLNSVISTLVGICLILGGLNSFSKTSLWVSILLIALGVGAISVGETVLKDSDVSFLVSAVLLAVVGFFQLKKIFESYGNNAWQRLLTKALAIVFPVCIMEGSVCSIIMQNRGLGTAFFEMGALCWIIHTVLVIMFLKQKAPAGVKSGKKTNSSSGGYGGASQTKVADSMKSLANYLTGGFDSLGYGVSVKYIVNASVSGDTISFTLSGKISGGDGVTESQVDSIKASLERVFDKRSQLIINEAKKELEKIGPDCDYSIEVTGGDISFN